MTLDPNSMLFHCPLEYFFLLAVALHARLYTPEGGDLVSIFLLWNPQTPNSLASLVTEFMTVSIVTWYVNLICWCSTCSCQPGWLWL